MYNKEWSGTDAFSIVILPPHAYARAQRTRQRIKVPHEGLFISEPHPSGFGNEGNFTPGKGKGKDWSCANWLQSRFHFSFAEYRGGRQQYGALRVLNDVRRVGGGRRTHARTHAHSTHARTHAHSLTQGNETGGKAPHQCVIPRLHSAVIQCIC